MHIFCSWIEIIRFFLLIFFDLYVFMCMLRYCVSLFYWNCLGWSIFSFLLVLKILCSLMHSPFFLLSSRCDRSIALLPIVIIFLSSALLETGLHDYYVWKCDELLNLVFYVWFFVCLHTFWFGWVTIPSYIEIRSEQSLPKC